VHWVMLSGLSLEQQMNIFRDATIIIAPHGAGLTNMIWANEGMIQLTVLLFIL
jgi:capsular polysaccharide biosynthesis protein